MKRHPQRMGLPALLIALAGVGVGCATYVPVGGGDNLAYLYGRGAAAVRLDARVYQASSTEATIYYQLHTADLLYKGQGGGGPYHARVRMGYEALPEPGSKALLDSASMLIRDESMSTHQDKLLVGSIPLRLDRESSFFLRITAHDLNRDARSTIMVRVERGEHGSGQDFMPLGGNGLPRFNDRIAPQGTLTIEVAKLRGQRLYVNHYPPIDKLPAPVFTNSPPPRLDGPPSDTRTVQVDQDGTFTFTVGESGYYHFTADTATLAGYTLFVAGPDFPTITTSEGMIEPLRYITSTREWQTITGSPDPVKAMEEFWINAAGNRERARKAIAAYYGRVENANRHFTSYTEGWKTDRGLVHIIFGTPSTIRKSQETETWVYGDESNLMSLIFNFRNRHEPFSDNDMVLVRDPQTKGAWYRNVESWRNGRVMSY